MTLTVEPVGCPGLLRADYDAQLSVVVDACLVAVEARLTVLEVQRLIPARVELEPPVPLRRDLRFDQPAFTRGEVEESEAVKQRASCDVRLQYRDDSGDRRRKDVWRNHSAHLRLVLFVEVPGLAEECLGIPQAPFEQFG